MRAATLARLAIGGACLVAPARVLDVVGGRDRQDPTVRLVARVLGGRLVLQGCGDLVLGRRTRVLGVVIDLSHAASMLPVIAGWSQHRRTATVSAAVASAIALLDVRAQGSDAGRPPGVPVERPPKRTTREFLPFCCHLRPPPGVTWRGRSPSLGSAACRAPESVAPAI